MRIIQELFDLGPAGVLSLTTALGHRPPYPAHTLGRARLFLGGGEQDRLECCTRPVAVDELERVVANERESMSHAVDSVRGYIEWVATQIASGFREAPTQAFAIGEGRMLLGFTGLVQPRVFRLVDIAAGKVVWEASVEDISKAFGLETGAQAGFGTDHQLVNTGGGKHAVLWLAFQTLIVDCGARELKPMGWTPKGLVDYWATKGHLLSMPTQENEYRVVRAEDGVKVARFAAPSPGKGYTRPVTSPGTERVALPHDGGTVDIVDRFGENHFSIRPFPRTGRNESVGCRLSHDGRWLTVRHWTCTRVVDLERRHVTELSTPMPFLDDRPGEIAYDSDVVAHAGGISVVHDGSAIHNDFESLSWQPVIEPGKRQAGRAAPPEFEGHLGAWRKAAIDLHPSKRAKTRSHLYGNSSLSARDVPKHEGTPMALVAAIDLAEVAAVCQENPWPKQGSLHFFVAIDGEGEPLLDEMFNPAAVRVIWKKSALPQFPLPGNIAPQVLRMTVHKADLPDIGAAVVVAQGLHDHALEEYRSHLERNKIADQPKGHRLGGYPTILQNNDLEAQAMHFADGAEFPPADLAALREAARWRLLLQMDSDDVFMWGTDSGTLYFMIHDDDLANRDFSRVVAVCEGY